MAEPPLFQSVRLRAGGFAKYEGPGDDPETVKIRRFIADGKTVQLSETIEQVNKQDVITIK